MSSRLWLLLFICCVPFICVKAEAYAVIKGKIEEKGKITELQLMTVKDGVPVKYAGTTIAPTGSFAFMFESENSGFYYLYNGQDYYRIYVKAKEEIDVILKDGYWHFSGVCSEENRLLEEWGRRERDLRTYRKDVPYGVFFGRFDSVRSEVTSWLDKQTIENKAFLTQLRTVIELDFLNDFVTYIGKNQQAYESEEQQSGYYQRLIRQFPADGESLLSQPYGIELVRKYFNYKSIYIFRGKEYTLEQKLDEITSPLLKAEFILMEADTGSFERFCEYENKYFPFLQNDEQRFRLRHTPGRPHSAVEIGKRASNFIYQDMAGNYRSMADFRGKYKYIDIWATWCAPCKAEIPHLRKLEAEFSGKEIEFISISIDKNRRKWEEYVRQEKLGGVQLWAGDGVNLPEELYVGSVPRFILIDRDGNWVDTNAVRPSDPALKELLKNLLKND